MFSAFILIYFKRNVYNILYSVFSIHPQFILYFFHFYANISDNTYTFYSMQREISMNNAQNIYELLSSNENKTFGERLSTCRKLAGKTQEDIAILIYQLQSETQQNHLSFCQHKQIRTFAYNDYGTYENGNFTECNESTLRNSLHPDFIKRIDTINDSLSAKEIERIRYKYGTWERKTVPNQNISFSLKQLQILKKIYGCDYAFLMCDSDYPHKTTEDIIQETGLLPFSVEKLTIYTQSKNASTDNIYIYLLQAIDVLVRNEVFLNVLSQFFSCFFEIHDKIGDWNLEPSDAKCIFKNKLIYSLKAFSTLPKQNTDSPRSNNMPPLCTDTSFASRLRALLKINNMTIKALAKSMYEYECKNKLNAICDSSIERNIHNWLSKSKQGKDIQLNLLDFSVLKNVLNCDYEYLLGDCNYAKMQNQDICSSLGLSALSIQIIKKYNTAPPSLETGKISFSRTLDILLTSDRLLLLFALYLTNLDILNSGINYESIIDIHNDDFLSNYYIKHNLLNSASPLTSTDLKELLLDEIIKELFSLRIKNIEDNDLFSQLFKAVDIVPIL